MVKTCSRPSLKTSDGRREKCKLKKEHHCLHINGDPEIGGENKIELDGLKFIKEEIFCNLFYLIVGGYFRIIKLQQQSLLQGDEECQHEGKVADEEGDEDQPTCWQV